MMRATSLRQKLRAILKRDHSEQMFTVRRMPVGLEREGRPALRSLADYMAARREEARAWATEAFLN